MQSNEASEQATYFNRQMSNRVRFIPNPSGGNEVLLIDLTGFAAPLDAIDTINEARSLIAAQPLSSVRCIVDVTAARFNTDVVEALKELAAANKPYMIATGLIGVTGLQRIILEAVIKFTARKNLKSMPSREEAFAWLAAQAPGSEAAA